MDISDRIAQVVDYANITANAFAVKIGVSQPRFRNYLNGRAPDYETLNRICKTFVMINEKWLLTGEGEMLKAEEQNSSDKMIIALQAKLIENLEEEVKRYKEALANAANI